MSVPRALLALPVIPLTGLLFASIGLAFTLRVDSMELFSFYFTLFLTPLFLFSDIFFPLEERFSGTWLLLAEALPLLHPVRLARFAFYGARDGYPSTLHSALGPARTSSCSRSALLLYARRWMRKRLTT